MKLIPASCDYAGLPIPGSLLQITDTFSPAMPNMQDVSSITPYREQNSVHIRLSTLQQLPNLKWKSRILRREGAPLG